MEDRETARMRKYGESKTTRIMMATVPHVTSGLGQKISGRWIFVDTSVHSWMSGLLEKLVVLFRVAKQLKKNPSRFAFLSQMNAVYALQSCSTGQIEYYPYIYI